MTDKNNETLQQSTTFYDTLLVTALLLLAMLPSFIFKETLT